MYACVMVFVAGDHQLQWLSHLSLPSYILLQRGVVREGHLECVGLAIWRRREDEGGRGLGGKREGDEQDSVLMLARKGAKCGWAYSGSRWSGGLRAQRRPGLTPGLATPLTLCSSWCWGLWSKERRSRR